MSDIKGAPWLQYSGMFNFCTIRLCITIPIKVLQPILHSPHSCTKTQLQNSTTESFYIELSFDDY